MQFVFTAVLFYMATKRFYKYEGYGKLRKPEQGSVIIEEEEKSWDPKRLPGKDLISCWGVKLFLAKYFFEVFY